MNKNNLGKHDSRQTASKNISVYTNTRIGKANDGSQEIVKRKVTKIVTETRTKVDSAPSSSSTQKAIGNTVAKKRWPANPVLTSSPVNQPRQSSHQRKFQSQSTTMQSQHKVQSLQSQHKLQTLQSQHKLQTLQLQHKLQTLQSQHKLQSLQSQHKLQSQPKQPQYPVPIREPTKNITYCIQASVKKVDEVQKKNDKGPTPSEIVAVLFWLFIGWFGLKWVMG